MEQPVNLSTTAKRGALIATLAFAVVAGLGAASSHIRPAEAKAPIYSAEGPAPIYGDGGGGGGQGAFPLPEPHV